MSYWVYMLRCKDGSLYTGSTDDVEKRAAAHNKGKGAKYTRGRAPVAVVYCEKCADRSAALTREAAIKTLSRREKERLLQALSGHSLSCTEGANSQSELRRIPGVGPKTEQDLLRLGYPSLDALKKADPEEIYRRDCAERGYAVDRCQLYVYRCAVYFASTPDPDPEKLKWWKWKDETARRIK